MGGCLVAELTVVVGMDLEALDRLLSAARERTGHSAFVVVGSLAILGILRQRTIPERMLLSRDVDCYTRDDPGRIFELQDELGEGSAFDQAHGYFLDPVSPNLPTLPDGWEQRLLEIVLPSGVHVHFLDPNDAAVSKYARGDVRDREWLRAGLAAGLLSIPVIDSRFRQTTFFDVAESRHARSQLEADEAWLAEGESA